MKVKELTTILLATADPESDVHLELVVDGYGYSVPLVHVAVEMRGDGVVLRGEPIERT